MRTLRRQKPSMADLAAITDRMRRHPRLQGCVAGFLMGESGGRTVYDWVRKRHHSTIIGGVTPTIGPRGGAWAFNGTTGYAQLPLTTETTFTLTTPFSIVVSAMALANASYAICQTAREASPFDGIWFTWGSGAGQNKTMFALRTADSAARKEIQATTALPLNTFTWLAITYDGSQTVAGMKIYQQGAAVATTTNANETLIGDLPARAFRIGTDTHTTPADFFNGVMDEVRIYNRVLTAAEMASFPRRPNLELEEAQRQWFGRRQQPMAAEAAAFSPLVGARFGLVGGGRGLVG